MFGGFEGEAESIKMVEADLDGLLGEAFVRLGEGGVAGVLEAVGGGFVNVLQILGHQDDGEVGLDDGIGLFGEQGGGADPPFVTAEKLLAGDGDEDGDGEGVFWHGDQGSWL